MSIYLLHFDEPLEGGQKPQHYLGWTDRPVNDRLSDHLNDRNRAARVVVAAVRYGRLVTVARIWPNQDRTTESLVKKQKKGYAHLCPICTPQPGDLPVPRA